MQSMKCGDFKETSDKLEKVLLFGRYHYESRQINIVYLNEKNDCYPLTGGATTPVTSN